MGNNKEIKRDSLRAACLNALWFIEPVSECSGMSQALANGLEIRKAAQNALPHVKCPKARKRLEKAIQGQ